MSQKVPTHYNFGLASDIPYDNYTETNDQYNIGAGQNNVCGSAQSTLYANVFQPSMINKTSEYKCAAYQPDYIGAEVNSVEATCTSCGGCSMSMDLSAWNRLPPAQLYACAAPGKAPQLVNPMFSVSGAPASALKTRDVVGLQMAANQQAAETMAANQQAVDAQIIANAQQEERAKTIAAAQQRVVPAALVQPTTFLMGANTPGAFGNVSSSGMY